MGSVFVAEKLATHQTFAVKFMQEALLAETSQVVRFQREIQALRAIRHPNVVDVFEWSLPGPGTAAEPPFIVMEMLEGEGLDQILKRMHVLPPAVAVEITLQILDGLGAAHAVGVVHRDLGPSNVFLEARPGGKFQVKILDFGLARPIGDEAAVNVTQEGTLMGKPAYVAPEAFLGRSTDARSDLFACGVMIYRMLTGRCPFRNVSAQMLWVERYAERDSEQEYPSMRTLVPSLPESLDRVVSTAIRRKPGARYATARLMQEALLGVERELGSAPRVLQIVPQSRSTNEHSSTVVGSEADIPIFVAPRRKRVIAIVAGVVVVLAAGLVLFLGGSPTEPAPARTTAAIDAGAAAPAVAHPKDPPVATTVDAAPSPQSPVHLAVTGTPAGAKISIGGVVLAGFPPEGDVTYSTKPVEVIVEATGYETHRTSIVPDRNQVLPVAMIPKQGTPALPVATPDAAVVAEPDAGRAPREHHDGGRVVRRDAGGAVVAHPPIRDAGGGRGREAASRLPVDLPTNSRRLPEDLPQ